MSHQEGAHAPEPGVALDSDEHLLAEFVRTRDQAVREELAARFMPLAEQLAVRYRDRGESLDDLKQVAHLGLLKALDGFDDSRGCSFPAYASPTIIGELRRHFRDKRWAIRVPRELKEAIPRIRVAVEDLSSDLGRMPDIEEIADQAGMEQEKVVEALEASDAARPVSLDAPAMSVGEDPAPLSERVGSEDEMLDQVDYGVMIEQRLERLSDRDREVLYLRFARDMTQTEIAEQVGVSQMQVSRILRAALEELREES